MVQSRGVAVPTGTPPPKSGRRDQKVVRDLRIVFSSSGRSLFHQIEPENVFSSPKRSFPEGGRKGITFWKKDLRYNPVCGGVRSYEFLGPGGPLFGPDLINPDLFSVDRVTFHQIRVQKSLISSNLGPEVTYLACGPL